MRSHRFYSDTDLNQGQSLTLPKEASHHCVHVLRYKAGAQMVLFNGDGFDYNAQIKSIEGKQCLVEIINKVDPQNESQLKVHLFQGIARGEKMDLIIQKSVELGVTQITPIFTERCNVKLDQKRLKKKQCHWQAVAISACEQSGRSFIPPINPPLNIKLISAFLDKESDSTLFYLEPTASKHLHSYEALTDIGLFIGPEGGLSDKDIQALDNTNVQGIKLGPRILRTETAGLAAIAILQSHFGDI
jgi:16S rRNA (uracil1498-N3)-methyltransferase